MNYPLSEHEAATLRRPAHLLQLRAKAHAVSQTALLSGSPDTLWPVFAYTDFLNQRVGMQETRNSYLNRGYGSTWMHAETKNSGLAVAYEELPYEWEAPHWYRVERIHSKGPLKYLSFGVRLQATEAGQTQVTAEISFVSVLPTPLAKVLINQELGKFMAVFRSLSDTLATGQPALRAYFEPLTAHQAQIQRLDQAWQAAVPQAEIRQALADYLTRAPERLAYRLRPFELAQAYALDPLEVLKACLRLSREAQLLLMWDCRCPGCKGPKESFRHLSQLKNLAYCPTCAVSYGLAFDQNLELTFQPAPALRKTEEKYFCAGSPGNTPHISMQHNLQAGERQRFELKLAPGPYVLRSLACSNEQILMLLPAGKVHPNAHSQLKIFANEAWQWPEISPQDVILLQAGAVLEIENQHSYEMSLSLENLYWQSEAVTAARVQAVQAFHDLFPEEVLAPGEALPLQQQIFLQIEIQGDSELLQWVQSRVQAHEGAFLAQSETVAWGLFATGFEALSAAWDLRQELENLQPLYPEPLHLALGLAEGPCEVFAEVFDEGLAEGLAPKRRLNYRGAAPALAAQAAQLSAGVGIVVAERLLQTPDMQLFLEDPFVSHRLLETPLEGRWFLFEFAPPFDADASLAELF